MRLLLHYNNPIMNYRYYTVLNPANNFFILCLYECVTMDVGFKILYNLYFYNNYVYIYTCNEFNDSKHMFLCNFHYNNIYYTSIVKYIFIKYIFILYNTPIYSYNYIIIVLFL